MLSEDAMKYVGPYRKRLSGFTLTSKLITRLTSIPPCTRLCVCGTSIYFQESGSDVHQHKQALKDLEAKLVVSVRDAHSVHPMWGLGHSAGQKCEFVA